MGRRSRKRGEAGTRAERDAQREPRASTRPRPGRPSIGERPRPPWGNFPLSELVILVGIVLILWGAIGGEEGTERLLAGLVIASLGGGELALREHLAGYRSHSSVLAGVSALIVVTMVALVLGPVAVGVLLVVGVAVFGASLYALRELFKRRSGGVGFR
jgi:hypothetical protein